MLEIEDDIVNRSIYEDSAGNSIVAGTGPQADPAAGQTKTPEKVFYVPGVPTPFMTEDLPKFKTMVKEGKAKSFKNTEYDAVAKSLKRVGTSHTIGDIAVDDETDERWQPIVQHPRDARGNLGAVPDAGRWAAGRAHRGEHD